MKCPRLLAFTCLLPFFFAQAASGQVPFQVKELNPGAGSGVGSSHLGGFGLANGGLFYFAGIDGTGDRELWTSNGTDAGTVRVADLNSVASSSPAQFFALDATRTLFRALHETDGLELWVTDGTAGGTTYLRDIDPGPSGSFPAFGAELGGEAFFRASDADGDELWKTDGTPAGTLKVMDIFPGPGSSVPISFAVANGQLFFGASDSPLNLELWTSDGTAAGTQMVIDLNPTGSGSVGELAEFNGEVYFRGSDGVTGAELWKSDGTLTVQVADLNPGSGSSELSSLYVFDGFLYFLATDGTNGREIWRTNGTPGNATRLTDVFPGSGDGVFPSQFCGASGVLVFAGQDGVNGRELWATDGNPDTEFLLAEVRPGSASGVEFQSLRCAGGLVYFSADDGSEGKEPWVSDGTVAGTVRLADISPGAPSSISFAPGFTEAGGLVYFPASDGLNGSELWAVAPSAPPVPSLSAYAIVVLVVAFLMIVPPRRRFRSRVRQGVLSAVAILAAGDADATILTFDQGVVGNRTPIDDTYGDDVESVLEGTLAYAVGSEGFTPNIQLTYGRSSPLLWTTGYGDLDNVLYEDIDQTSFLEVTFQSDPGFAVELLGFDLSAFSSAFGTDPTIDRVSVTNGTSVIFEAEAFTVSRSAHTALDFTSAPLVASTLVIQIDARNLQGRGDDIAIDNIRFGQVVPEPKIGLLLGLGLAALCRCRPGDRMLAGD